MTLQQRKKLALAVELTDDFTPTAPPQGAVSVSLKGRPGRPLERRSGHRLFVGLGDGSYTIEIRPALYLSEERQVTVPLTNPRNPVLAVRLKPRWHYPFPAGATLIFGVVRESAGNPIANAVVSIVERAAESRSAEDGRFVLYLKGLTEDDVVVTGGRRLVKATGTTTAFRLRLTHPRYRTRTVTIGEIEEGRARRLPAPLALTPR